MLAFLWSIIFFESSQFRARVLQACSSNAKTPPKKGDKRNQPDEGVCRISRQLGNKRCTHAHLNNFENVFECSGMGTCYAVRCLNGAMAGTLKALFIN